MNYDEFTQSLGFVAAFVVACGLITITLGERVLQGFLWLVLASMVVANTDKIKSLVGRYSSV
jgi:hypothetical protein